MPKAKKKAKRAPKRKRKSPSTSAEELLTSESEADPRTDVFELYDISAALREESFEQPTLWREVPPEEITVDFVRQGKWKVPLLVKEDPTALGMKVPKREEFSVDTVKNLIGEEQVIDVVDVRTQSSCGMTLGDFVHYYKGDPSLPDRELLNVLSLEFSLTPLEEHVRSPEFVRQIDWVELYWPEHLRCLNADREPPVAMYPKVQHYCLMSVENCFTDFHIDFAGTSVWYHVLKGKKVFWMVEPTEHNIRVYEEWLMHFERNSTFFGYVALKCARIEVCEGQSLIIPSGWIHAVFTAEDSLVFGGNFLHSAAIEMQLRVHSSEKQTKVTRRYRYPFFNEMLWFVVEGVLRRATGRSFLKKDCKEEDVKEEDVKDVFSESFQKETEEREAISEANEEVMSLDSGCGVTTMEGDVSTMTVEGKRVSDTSTTFGAIKISIASADANMEIELDEESDEIDVEGGIEEEKPQIRTEKSPEDVKTEIKIDDVIVFDEDYVKEMTAVEKVGFGKLLEHLRKSLRLRNRTESSEAILDPNHLLLTFKKLLDYKESLDPDVVIEDDEAKDVKDEIIIEDEKAASEKEESTVASEERVTPPRPRSKQRRGVKRSAPKPPEKAKPSKSKGGRKAAEHPPDRPLIVGGLPPAIMPASAAQAPNPYNFDPLSQATKLGRVQYQSAYRRTRDMPKAKAGPAQKFRLQSLSKAANSSSSRSKANTAEAEPEGDNGEAELKVDAHNEDETAERRNEIVVVLDDGDSNGQPQKRLPSVSKHRRGSEPSTSGGHSTGDMPSLHSHRANRDARAPAPHHKSCNPEMEYRSPLTSAHHPPVTPTFPKSSRKESSASSGSRGDNRLRPTEYRRHTSDGSVPPYRDHLEDFPPRGNFRNKLSAHAGHEEEFFSRDSHRGDFPGRSGRQDDFAGRGSHHGDFGERRDHPSGFTGRDDHQGDSSRRGGHHGDFAGRGGFQGEFPGRGGHRGDSGGRDSQYGDLPGRGGPQGDFAGRGGRDFSPRFGYQSDFPRSSGPQGNFAGRGGPNFGWQGDFVGRGRFDRSEFSVRRRGQFADRGFSGETSSGSRPPSGLDAREGAGPICPGGPRFPDWRGAMVRPPGDGGPFWNPADRRMVPDAPPRPQISPQTSQPRMVAPPSGFGERTTAPIDPTDPVDVTRDNLRKSPPDADSGLETEIKYSPPSMSKDESPVQESREVESLVRRGTRDGTASVGDPRREDADVKSEDGVKMAFGFPVPITKAQRLGMTDRGGSTTKTVAESGYRPTPICSLPPREDSALGIPTLQFEKDPTVCGILKRPPMVLPSPTTAPPQMLSPTVFSPPSSSSASSNPPFAPFSGVGGIGGLNSGEDRNSKRNVPIPHSNRLFNESLLEVSRLDARKSPPREMFDHVTSTNELARLSHEIDDDIPSVANVHSGNARRTDTSTTVVSDPRRSKMAPPAEVEVKAEDDEPPSDQSADAGLPPSPVPPPIREPPKPPRVNLVDGICSLESLINQFNEYADEDDEADIY